MESNNSKIFIILGSFAVLGAGIYFYFKTKKTPTLGGLNTRSGGIGSSATNSSNTGSVGTGSSSTGSAGTNANETVLSTPEEVIEKAKKIALAKDLANKISDLRNKKNNLTLLINAYEANPSPYVNSPEGNANIRRKKDVEFYTNSIKDLEEQIIKLGYMESNGSIVKI